VCDRSASGGGGGVVDGVGYGRSGMIMQQSNRFWVVATIILLASSIQAQAIESEAVPTDDTASYEIKESCEAVEGLWGAHGLFVEEFCVLPAADAGNECSDFSECEGDCIAELTAEEERLLVEEFGQHVLEKTGTCSQWQQMFGCYPFISEGKVTEILCVD